MERADIPFVAAWMVEDDLWQRYRLSKERIAADFQVAFDRDDLLLTVDTDGPVRGFAWCLPEGMFGFLPYLKRIGVDPAHAGQGLGSLLLEQLETELRARRQWELFLLVSDFNSEAQRFYRQRGYFEIGRMPDLVLPGVAEILFRKHLGASAP